MTKRKMGSLSKDAISRTIFLAIVWWILTDGVPESWLVGLPTVFISAFVSTALASRSHSRFKLFRIANFIGLFAVASVRGGIDVAKRVFHPGLPIKPDLVDYPLKLDNPSARILMANTISLLPGTLSVELHDNVIKVHVLDSNQPVGSDLQAVESVIEGLYRQK